ncbi:nitric oxide synthase-interacting protein-like [Antedon mediterranea]|uniref:nitric oxide synthase-interacting protein-like n=1 Tax=Antedon mediterranea TaxID=105859 RepID=UPI003AF6248C
MTRHQRNATAGSVYTYHERQKDAATSGYGTKHARLSKDSVKDFDCCNLTLQPCANPVVTAGGYLYDKEAILEYILQKKQEFQKKMKEYEKQKKKEEEEESNTLESKVEERKRAFVKQESSIVSKPINPFTEAPSAKKQKLQNDVDSVPGTSTVQPDRSKQLPSFWIPSQTPQATATKLKKPDKTVYCPMSQKPIKMKDLITVNFTLADEKDSQPLVAKKVRYKCAVTHDILSNSVPCVVLKPSGKVVTQECYEKLVKKDMLDPESGEKLEESDIITLKRGGTGFASSGVELAAKKARPVMMAS